MKVKSHIVCGQLTPTEGSYAAASMTNLSAAKRLPIEGTQVREELAWVVCLGGYPTARHSIGKPVSVRATVGRG